jgi:hypothetical protein
MRRSTGRLNRTRLQDHDAAHAAHGQVRSAAVHVNSHHAPVRSDPAFVRASRPEAEDREAASEPGCSPQQHILAHFGSDGGNGGRDGYAAR